MSPESSAAQRLHDDLALAGDTGAALLVDSLTEREADRLHTLVASAREANAAEVGAAVDRVLGALPSAVRGRVRKMVQRGDR